MLTPKIGKYRGSLDSLGEPVRPAVETGQIGLGNIFKLPTRLHHCVDLIEMIEMHIFNVQFGVQIRKLYLPKDLHPRSDRSDRSRAVRPV